jgi:hypothetical protein
MPYQYTECKAKFEPRDSVAEPQEKRGNSIAQEKEQIGLCATCRHMRKIQSDRGSIFYFCQRSATDERFPKYPRLPVLQCPGYEDREG